MTHKLKEFCARNRETINAGIMALAIGSAVVCDKYNEKHNLANQPYLYQEFDLDNDGYDDLVFRNSDRSISRIYISNGYNSKYIELPKSLLPLYKSKIDSLEAKVRK